LWAALRRAIRYITFTPTRTSGALRRSVVPLLSLSQLTFIFTNTKIYHYVKIHKRTHDELRRNSHLSYHYAFVVYVYLFGRDIFGFSRKEEPY
jgi:hypothetical protein